MQTETPTTPTPSTTPRLPTTTLRCHKHPDAEAEFVKLENHRMYGHFICSECNKHITWAKTPKTSANLRERQDRIRLAILNLEDEDVHELLLLYNIPHLKMHQMKYEKLMKKAGLSI